MKKLMYLFGAMALMVGFVACSGNEEEKLPDGPISFDGFYIYGEAVGTQEFLAVNQMAAGSNEVTKTPRAGMFEKYIWLEGGKEFSLVEKKAANQVFYGAELDEVNYGFDANDPDCKNFADNPNMKILAGKMIIGEEAPKMQVAESGMYHIVLDNNTQGDLEFPQIIIHRAEWGVRGDLNGWGFTPGERTINADGSITYAWTAKVNDPEAENNILFKNKGGFKFASCHGWKINLDVDGNVKAETSLGWYENKLSNAGAENNIIVDKPGYYNITLTWKPSAGAVGDAFSHTIEKVADYVSELPTSMFINGNVFGGTNWDWSLDTIVEMTPVNGVEGSFWAVRYLPANSMFKFSETKDWEGHNFGLDADGNEAAVDCKVTEDGLYLFVINGTTEGITGYVKPASVCGLGDAFGGWDATNAGQVAMTVNADGTASITATAAGLLRAFAKIEGVDAWKSEFSVLDGKIVYRGNGGDFKLEDDKGPATAVAVTAGQTVTFDFNAGTATIQ